MERWVVAEALWVRAAASSAAVQVVVMDAVTAAQAEAAAALYREDAPSRNSLRIGRYALRRRRSSVRGRAEW